MCVGFGFFVFGSWFLVLGFGLWLTVHGSEQRSRLKPQTPTQNQELKTENRKPKTKN
jgi:hypothetical protein